jgi:hypothetical protein
MNKHGRAAEATAKEPGHSPFALGNLVASIQWENAKRKSFTGLITGNLSVGVPYGRRQEFEHKSRSFYLRRAIAKHFPKFVASLRRKGVIENILLGRRVQRGSAGVAGGAME